MTDPVDITPLKAHRDLLPASSLALVPGRALSLCGKGESVWERRVDRDMLSGSGSEGHGVFTMA